MIFLNKKQSLFLIFMGIFSANVQVMALDQDQQQMQEMLNQQVLSQSFNVADDAKLTNSLSEATERGTPTKTKQKTSENRYWHNGYYYPYWAYSRSYWY